jgi:hypothetical protein
MVETLAFSQEILEARPVEEELVVLAYAIVHYRARFTEDRGDVLSRAQEQLVKLSDWLDNRGGL